MKLRIGILQTDSVLEEFQPRFGDYPQMFEALLRGAARHFDGLELELPVFRTHEGELPPAADDCVAYLITGSRESVYADLPWIATLAEFVAEALDSGAKIIGICFGHQLLAHFFGGHTEAAAVGWNVGVHCSRVIAPQRWMVPALRELRLLSSHKDQVTRIPEGAAQITSSDSCPVAGFVMGDQVMTLQGHPEFNKGYAESLMRKREALLGPEVFSDGISSLEQNTDEDVAGRWILNFVLQPVVEKQS
jgi:GMP synthase-like glutamine amidotransferase